MFKIEKGIPMSKRRKYPFAEMEIGDSVFIEGLKSVAEISGSFRGHRPKKFATRQVDGGIRVWRIA
jgi:hypothetical protein